MTDDKTAVDLKNRVLDIIYKNRLPIGQLEDVRELILTGDSEGATATLVAEYGLSRDDAEAVVEFIGPVIRGRRVTFVEIGHEEIHFPSWEEASDAEDLFEPAYRYFGRRGQTLGPVITTSRMVDGRQVDKVFFANQFMEACRLDQVWKIVTDEVESEVPSFPSQGTLVVQGRKDVKKPTLEELLAARRALNLKYPLEVYETLELEPDEILAYTRLAIEYDPGWDDDGLEYVSYSWSAVPGKYITADGSIRPEYRSVCTYPPIPEGMYSEGGGV